MLGFLYSPLIDSVIDDKSGSLMISDARPWLKSVPDKLTRLNKDGIKVTSAELGAAYYFKWKYPHIQLDLLDPHETTYDDLSKYDIVFVFNHTKADAYVYDTYVHFKHLQQLLTHPNIYPPKSWSDVVDHKQHMYEHLKRYNIPVLPLHYISSDKYKADPERAVNELRNYFTSNGIKKFFLRPEFGTCSVDISDYDTNVLDNYQEWKEIENIIFKYPGVFVTPFCKGFTSFGEYKCYFYQDKLMSVLNYNSDESELLSVDISTPEIQPIVKLAKRTMKTFSKYHMKHCTLPRILTRVDISCWTNSSECTPSSLFVNEIEAAPGFFDFDEDISRNFYDENALYLDKICGEGIFNVYREYIAERATYINRLIMATAILVCVLIILIWIRASK